MNKTAKKWCIAFLIVMLLVLGGIAAANVYMDPYGYFTFQSGNYDDIDFYFKENDVYQRTLKANHVENYHDQYDAYIIGGSKTSSYRVEKLSELDGYRYYNYYNLSGNCYEYELAVRYLLKTAQPKKIILSISNSDLRYYQRDTSYLTNRIPAELGGTSKLAEYWYFLFRDVVTSYDTWKSRQVKEQSSIRTTPASGERNLDRAYAKAVTDWDGNVQKSVTNELFSQMAKLFGWQASLPGTEQNLEAIRQIKAECDAAGVELLVILSPSFLAEMSEYEGTDYERFQMELAKITDYWDFEDYSDMTLNPYNYYNQGHFYYELGDAVVDRINGKDLGIENFGVYVTRDTVMEHLSDRRERYNALKAEYESKGSITLKTKKSPSCLVKDLSLYSAVNTSGTDDEADDFGSEG